MTDRRRAPRRAASHPLFDLFPLATMAIASFLVILAILMARVNAGAGGPLPAQVQIARNEGSRALARGPLSTRSSGAPAPGTNPPVASPGSVSAAPLTVVTRSSGGRGEAAGQDG